MSIPLVKHQASAASPRRPTPCSRRPCRHRWRPPSRRRRWPHARRPGLVVDAPDRNRGDLWNLGKLRFLHGKNHKKYLRCKLGGSKIRGFQLRRIKVWEFQPPTERIPCRKSGFAKHGMNQSWRLSIDSGSKEPWRVKLYKRRDTLPLCAQLGL